MHGYRITLDLFVLGLDEVSTILIPLVSLDLGRTDGGGCIGYNRGALSLALRGARITIGILLFRIGISCKLQLMCIKSRCMIPLLDVKSESRRDLKIFLDGA
jgi:hypothetical protein